MRVPLAADKQDGEGEGKEDGGEKEREVESHVTLSVGHAELSGEGSDVDKEVVPVVHPGGGHRRVDDHALTLLGREHVHLRRDLLRNKRREVGL